MDSEWLYEVLSEWGCNLGCQDSLQLVEITTCSSLVAEEDADGNT